MKAHLLEYLLGEIKFVILKGKSFTCLTTAKLIFLDVKNYIAPGFDYVKFIRAYEVEQQRFYWGYEWFQNFQQLDEPTLPPHEVFYSSLKKENISQEAYALCQTVWKEKNWTSMRDHLEYYINLDLEPFLQAVEKLFNANKELGLDSFKSSLTLPGLTLHLMFSDLPPGVYFSLINQSNSDLHHQLIKKNVCGGLSVVFHREHQADVIYIRHREFGENAKLCKKILGYDANSLYLGALKLAMPTGHFIRYQTEKDLKPSICHRTGLLAMQWLEWVAADKQVQIQHKFNGSELRIGPRQLPVDGYCADSKTVFQFHGCWYHGHHCAHITDKKTNQIKKRTWQSRSRRSASRNTRKISLSAWLCREPGGGFANASGCTRARRVPRKSLSMG